MGRLPDAVFVVDTRKEKIAVDEARKLKIPVIGVVDTNCDPDEVDYVIPGNDDALRSIRLFAAGIADAVLAGPRHARSRAAAEETRRTRDGQAAERSGAPAPSPAASGTDARAGLGRRASQRNAALRAGRPSPRAGARFVRAHSVISRRTTERHGRRSPQHQVKQLRDKTGAGMMECKAALDEANGNIEEAIDAPAQEGPRRRRPRGPGAPRSEGLIGSYIHMGGKIGVLVEVNCETDFVARTDDFQTLVKDVGHAHRRRRPAVRRAARRCRPRSLEKEKEIYRAQMADQGKPANVVEKIVEGKLGELLLAGRAARPAVRPRPERRRSRS